MALLLTALGDGTVLDLDDAGEDLGLTSWANVTGVLSPDAAEQVVNAVVAVRQPPASLVPQELRRTDVPVFVVSLGPDGQLVDRGGEQTVVVADRPEVSITWNGIGRSDLGETWQLLRGGIDPASLERVGDLSARLRGDIEGGAAATERLDFRLRAVTRSLERQDRRLHDLRAKAQLASVLQRDNERLERELGRTLSRRSVRVSLWLAAFFRPLFRVVRGQARTPAFIERLVLRGRHRTPPRAGARTEWRTQPPGDLEKGYFHELIAPVVNAASSTDFRRMWERSEGELRQELAGDPGHWGRVAIVMPTYNRAPQLAEAIRSVLDQSYEDWELHVCDDGSTDSTASVVSDVADARIHYHRLEHAGAAAARNHGLRSSTSPFVAYLDSDNVWHPGFLQRMLHALSSHPGRHAAYSTYVDVEMVDGEQRLKKARHLPFDYERLATKNFIDLNTYVHRRNLSEAYGGFDETLSRQQDWDLLLRHSFHHEPLYVDRLLLLYRRNERWAQITRERRHDTRPPERIREAVAQYYAEGLPQRSTASPTLTVLSWDVCRNHFSKAYNVAEALRDGNRVQLLGFRFFEGEVFGPYADARPEFEFDIMEGGPFPEWSSEMARAVARVRGDVIYAVKPRLPSLGVALLANYHFGTPVVLEINDLESVVERPQRGRVEAGAGIDDVDPADPRLLNPYGALWTSIMESLAHDLPYRATHNDNLDRHFGGGAFRVRNPKDDEHFDPSRYDRRAVRAELGISPSDRVILFGGMVRQHKGVFELVELVTRAGPDYRLLVVGSRETPDQRRLRDVAGDRVTLLDHVDRNAMARVNLAADAVVLRLDPSVPASHYQMPFKLTDAMAMQVPVIANDISDLGDLGRRGYLRLVPFDDDEALIDTLHDLEDDPAARECMVAAARRLYVREFSYRATRAALDRMADVVAPQRGVLPAAERFARFFAQFRVAQGMRSFAGRP